MTNRTRPRRAGPPPPGDTAVPPDEPDDAGAAADPDVSETPDSPPAPARNGPDTQPAYLPGREPRP